MAQNIIKPTCAMVMLALGCAAACASLQTKHLAPSVEHYVNSLKWKRFSDAASYLPFEKRAAFLHDMSAIEEDLYFDSIEITDIALQPNNPKRATVVVAAESYLLPSTILKRHRQVQDWQLIDDIWTLVDTKGALAGTR